MKDGQIGLKQEIHKEIPAYSIDIRKEFIKKDFILLEQEFCAKVTSKL